MKRNIPETSLEAYRAPENKQNRASHKEVIRSFFLNQQRKAYTIREVSQAIGLRYAAVQKRISDLRKEGFLEISGKKEEEGNNVGLFQMVAGQQKLFSQRPLNRYEILKKTMKEQLLDNLYHTIVREAEQRWKNQKNGVSHG